MIEINNICCSALLDTGSSVSAISHSFFLNKLSCILNPIEDLLNIECANGNALKYHGYIIASLGVPSLLNSKPMEALFLVVPDTPYNSKVPVLLGTNVLIPFMKYWKQQKTEGYMQSIASSTPWWLTFRCLSLQGKRQSEKLGIVKAMNTVNISISPNKSCTIMGFVDQKRDYNINCQLPAMIQATSKSVLPDGVELSPLLIQPQQSVDQPIPVVVNNHTHSTIVIPPNSRLCELQHVEVVNDHEPHNPPTINEQEDCDFMSYLSLDDTDLTDVQKERVRKLLLDFRSIFSQDEFDIGHTQTVRHRIDLTNDIPFKQK